MNFLWVTNKIPSFCMRKFREVNYANQTQPNNVWIEQVTAAIYLIHSAIYMSMIDVRALAVRGIGSSSKHFYGDQIYYRDDKRALRACSTIIDSVGLIGD